VHRSVHIKWKFNHRLVVFLVWLYGGMSFYGQLIVNLVTIMNHTIQSQLKH